MAVIKDRFNWLDYLTTVLCIVSFISIFYLTEDVRDFIVYTTTFVSFIMVGCMLKSLERFGTMREEIEEHHRLVKSGGQKRPALLFTATSAPIIATAIGLILVSSKFLIMVDPTSDGTLWIPAFSGIILWTVYCLKNTFDYMLTLAFLEYHKQETSVKILKAAQFEKTRYQKVYLLRKLCLISIIPSSILDLYQADWSWSVSWMLYWVGLAL